MWKIIPYSLLQSILLAAGQLMMKLALNNMSQYQGFWRFIGKEMTNWWWLGCGLSMGGATVLWFYIMKNFPLSVAYPLSCLSFVFGMLGAMAFLGEQIPIGRWIGIGLILAGAALISR